MPFVASRCVGHSLNVGAPTLPGSPLKYFSRFGYFFNGCFARYCLVDEERVHLLPDNVGFIAGALSEPLACVSTPFSN
jgi:threonine dehydrogenase-like Zn-dependent dehydrogenase